MAAVDLRAGCAGVFGLFSTTAVFSFPPDKMGLKTFGDFNLLLSFFLLPLADVAMETLASLFATGWKNGLAVGDPKTNVPDLFRFVTDGLKTGIFAGLSTLFLETPIDCKK